MGVRLDSENVEIVDWLEALGVASFEKDRDNGAWRIFTATFDLLVAGRRFFENVSVRIIGARGAVTRVKLEQTDRFFRFPANAPTLPLSYSWQLEKWLEAVERCERAKSS